MKIFVTDGDNRAALAVTRSLGRAGHEVFVGEKHGNALAHTSRFCGTRVVYPDPVRWSGEFVQFLARFIKERGVELLIPVADITMFLVTRSRESFEPACQVPFPAAAIVDRAADKIDMVQTASRLGVAVPRSLVVPNREWSPGPDQEYPLVVKPSRSRVRTADGWMSSGVSYAEDRESLRKNLQSRPDHEFPLMLQERLSGAGVGVFACYQRGRAVALFAHRRLRERPPWGGVSVLSESTPLDPVAATAATRLLDELGWHGVAMVEFKRDDRDGVPKLMEINGRFWGSLQLAIDAGVDFPALLVKCQQAEPLAAQPPYRIGTKSRWLWGDVDALLLNLFGRSGGPHDFKTSRWRSCLEFLKFKGQDLNYENPRWDDLGPWWLESKRWLRLPATLGGRRLPAVAPAIAAPMASSAPATLTTRVGRHLNEIGLDEAGWNALAAKSGTNSIFQTHQWARSWCKTFDTAETMFVTAADEAGGAVVGVAPLVLDRSRTGDRVLRFVGQNRADYCDILSDAARPAVAERLVEELVQNQDWDRIDLSHIPVTSPTTDLVRQAAARAGFNVIVDDSLICPALLIEGHQDFARDLIDRSSIRRRHTYLARTGRLEYRHLTTAEDVAPYLDRFFQQHIERWNDTGSPSLFLEPGNDDFYRELAANLSGTGWLLFSVVEFNGQPIAFHYGFDYDGAVIWYKPSFSVSFAQRSPGLVMLRMLIAYALENGRRELDFTLGDEEFKKRFTNHSRRCARIQVFRHRLGYATALSKRALLSTAKLLTPGR